jgi:hypothetical protein
MRNARARNGDFSWRNGWNVSKVGALLNEIFAYLQTIDQKRFHMFCCTVDLNAHRKLTESGIKLRDPIGICADYCARPVLEWYVRHYPGIIHSCHYFFDKDEPFEDSFKEIWGAETANQLGIDGSREFYSLIKTVTSAETKEYPGLQMADLLAWSNTRTLCADEGALGKYYHYFLRSVVPNAAGFFGEKALLAECEM